MTTIIDRIDSAADRIRDDELLADKKRFESFKLGGATPSQSSRRHSHSRSHSRNVSIISVSQSLSFPSSLHELSLSSSHSSSTSISSLSQPGPTPPTAKRNSHHRRRSSVSTRRESAEVMGVALPALSTSNSEDNMSDKDAIRRRALWALEGKSSPDGFSPVEIPELNTPEIERRISELPSKPSFPPSMGSFTSSLSGLANIRDSFKDQLHTLVEEEEEEEEPTMSPASALSLPAAVTVSPSPARHRPAGLTLRPLSLSPDRLVTGELPTPESAPTPTKLSGLKSLTLATSPSLASSSPDGVLSKATAALHRRSVVVPTSSSVPFFRRASLSESTSSTSSDPFEVPRKRSSISYKSSFHGLPTPELTPTTEGRPSMGSEAEWGRPLTNEQHFLYQSQAALVARISELERTLSSRSQPRPVSFATSDSSLSDPEPTDEMLRLIADLKAERDELRRDIDGWRTRVADLEHRSGMLALRVDTERREAWIARERLSLLEVEKRAAVRTAEESDAVVKGLRAELNTTKADVQEEAERSKEIVHELERVRAELMEERRLREDLEKALEELSLLKTPTPVVPIRRMMSIDSMSSATDVDSLDEHTMSGPELKAVQEVDEDEEEYSEQENTLMGYEDEEEGDECFTSNNGSSFGSLDDIPRSTTHLVRSRVSSPSRTPSPASLPAHTRQSSLSREWCFPAKGAPHSASPQQHFPEEVDRFFGCLEDMGDSPPISVAPPETTSPFTKGFFGATDEEEGEMPPFVLPADVGVEIESPPASFSKSGLSVVLEEDEDRFVGEEDEGGIKFTFEIPHAFTSPASPTTHRVPTPRKPVPFCEDLASEDDDTAFSFPLKSASPPTPSAIPRATVLKRFEGPAKRASPSPPATSSRHGRPSFLPLKTIAPPTFIPHPSTKMRVPLPSSMPCRSQPPPSGATALSGGGGTFAALQNLASFVVPWSITRSADSDAITNDDETKKEIGGLVSKESQLARLRVRMAEEGVVCLGQQVNVPCRRCVDRVVAP